MTDTVNPSTKRVLELAEDAADLTSDLIDRLDEMHAHLGVAIFDVIQLVRSNMTEDKQRWFDNFCSELPAAYRADPYYRAEPTSQETGMRRLLARLFAEAPKLADATGPVPPQAPAIMAHINLRFGQPMFGSLSTTPEGTLRMLTPSEFQDSPTSPKRKILIETFFEYEDVVAVMVERPLEQASSIITS